MDSTQFYSVQEASFPLTKDFGPQKENHILNYQNSMTSKYSLLYY